MHGEKFHEIQWEEYDKKGVTPILKPIFRNTLTYHDLITSIFLLDPVPGLGKIRNIQYRGFINLLSLEVPHKLARCRRAFKLYRLVCENEEGIIIFKDIFKKMSSVKSAPCVLMVFAPLGGRESMGKFWTISGAGVLDFELSIKQWLDNVKPCMVVDKVKFVSVVTGHLTWSAVISVAGAKREGNDIHLLHLIGIQWDYGDRSVTLTMAQGSLIWLMLNHGSRYSMSPANHWIVPCCKAKNTVCRVGSTRNSLYEWLRDFDDRTQTTQYTLED